MPLNCVYLSNNKKAKRDARTCPLLDSASLSARICYSVSLATDDKSLTLTGQVTCPGTSPTVDFLLSASANGVAKMSQGGLGGSVG